MPGTANHDALSGNEEHTVMQVATDPKPLILPPPLVPGNTIGLFCPAGPVRDQAAVKAGIAWLRQQGFRVKTCRDLGQTGPDTPYLAGPDRDRAKEIHRLWRDPDVKALWAVRGGFGCLRLLDLLDFDLFRQHPKLVIGFSDVTALLAALFSRAGIMGIHGPALTTICHTETHCLEALRGIVHGNYMIVTGRKCRCVRPGTARGNLIVANLTTLTHLLATPWEPDLRGAILVLEDTGESLYRIDRMLTQLSLAGRLDTLAGLILARFDHAPDRIFSQAEQDSLARRALTLTSQAGCPVWSGFPAGHGRDNHALPFGMEASMGNDTVLGLHPPGTERHER